MNAYYLKIVWHVAEQYLTAALLTSCTDQLVTDLLNISVPDDVQNTEEGNTELKYLQV